MLELFKKTETLNPSFYETCVERYGENLDKEDIKASFFASENPSAWATFVLIPLREYFQAYYEEHPDDPNIEVFADRGAAKEYWGNPIKLLR